jgi:TolB-like protein/Tfp pilus assembly protein PilF/class 3 adenylate cyclase
MPSEQSSEVKFEIGHVLFIDIVGYSKLLINQQSDQLETLKQIVRGTEQFRTAEAEGKLLRLPTGDGGALVFRNSPEAPVLCALEISRELKNHPELKVRMGIHSGPVNAITDLNEQANIAGAGINYAQRVMDCGDAGHILLSRHVAEDLEAYPRWQPHLHDLGQTAVKHGVIVAAVNLYTDDAGNPAVPERFRTAESAATAPPPKRSGRPSLIAAAILVALLLAALVGYQLIRSRSHVEGGAPATPNIDGLAGARPSISNKSIAVLPFENLSSDKENAYFAQGIQDEILTKLSKIADLKVISRTSTQKYTSAPDNLRDIGKQLGVAHLVEGSVQKIANAVHVNVQLVRAATDEHLWAESYNRKLDDVFGVEGEVASAIAEQLKAKLTGAEAKAVNDKPTDNVAAYDSFLHGIALESPLTENAKMAAAAYAQAVRLDPKFALAWARLAIIQSYLYFNGVEPTKNSGPAVKEAADRALALQPELGESLLAQGVYCYRILRDFPAALQSYTEALKRLPSSALVLEQMAHLERRLGQTESAEKHYQMAAQLDPRNLDILLTLADLLGSLRRFKEAEDAFDRVLQISPGNEHALAQKAFLFQSEGMLDKSAKVLSSIPADSKEDDVALAKMLQLYFERNFDAAITQLQNSPSPVVNDPRSITLLGYCQLLAGRTSEAQATLQRAISIIKPSPDSVVPVDARLLPCFMALVYSDLGEKEKALDYARQGIADYQNDVLAKPFAEAVLAQTQARFGETDAAIAAIPHLLEVVNGITRGNLRVDPAWDPLRKDPRFQNLCKEPIK